jgi:hypothetical protein
MDAEVAGLPLESRSLISAAPELLMGECPTVKSDIFSLALAIFWILTGSPAFDPSLSRAPLKLGQLMLSSIRPALPPAVAASIGEVIHRM